MHALLVLLSAATIVQAPAPTAAESDIARWKRAGERGHHRAGRLGHRAHPRKDRRRCRVRDDLRPGGGRLQPDRDQLSQFDGPAGGGGGGGRHLAGPEDEALHRSRQDEGEVRGQPRVVKEIDERLGRRAQLLPPCQSQGEAAGHHPVRAVDGADVQRGEHRRRHRERGPRPAPGVLRGQREQASAARWRVRSLSSQAAPTASRSRRRTPSTAGRSSSSIPTRRSSSAPSSR